MSSVFWRNWRCVLGIAARSKTGHNMNRTGEYVINMPSVNRVDAGNRIVLTTGMNPVPEWKRQRGYRYEADKFAVSRLTPQPSITVAPPRVRECPVQMEAVVEAVRSIAENDPAQRGAIRCFETRVQRVHADDAVLLEGKLNHIDPDQWRSLIMSFQKFYGLRPQIHESTLASIPESMYRTPDIERAGTAQCCTGS